MKGYLVVVLNSDWFDVPCSHHQILLLGQYLPLLKYQILATLLMCNIVTLLLSGKTKARMIGRRSQNQTRTILMVFFLLLLVLDLNQRLKLSQDQYYFLNYTYNSISLFLRCTVSDFRNVFIIKQLIFLLTWKKNHFWICCI